jgi:hypothetical protein
MSLGDKNSIRWGLAALPAHNTPVVRSSGVHALAPGVSDPVAQQFFNPWLAKASHWVFLVSLICMPVFLALGFVPTLMASLSERRGRKSRRAHPT